MQRSLIAMRAVSGSGVGFSIVGALVGFTGTMLWLRGVRLVRNLDGDGQLC